MSVNNDQKNSNKRFSSENRKELMQYIEENCYMNLSEYDYSIASMDENALSGCDVELIERVSLVRMRLARKKRDEEYYNAFLKKAEKEKKRESQQLNFVDFSTRCKTFSFTDEMSLPRATFNETLDRFIKEKGIENYAELCKLSNLNEDTLSKIRNGVLKNPNRNFLFALAIGLKLDLSETEELFNSCGQSTKGCFRKEDEERERAIEYFIKEGWDIRNVNEVLYSMGMTLLGNNALP